MCRYVYVYVCIYIVCIYIYMHALCVYILYIVEDSYSPIPRRDFRGNRVTGGTEGLSQETLPHRVCLGPRTGICGVPHLWMDKIHGKSHKNWWYFGYPYFRKPPYGFAWKWGITPHWSGHLFYRDDDESIHGMGQPLFQTKLQLYMVGRDILH